MIDNPKKLFATMYKVLNEIWESTQAEDLRIYVSDADPFLCDDGESADPVVSEDFNALYEQKRGSNITDYDFIIYYLENLDPYYGDIKKYFITVSKEEFEKKLKD